jgi:hypothetical protein
MEIRNPILEPIADALQMYLSYTPPGIRKVEGQMRFAMKAEPKLKFTMKVLDSFEDKNNKELVVLVEVAKRLFLLVDHAYDTKTLTIRVVSSERLGIALGQKKKLFSMFSTLPVLLKGFEKGILAAYRFRPYANSWEKIA